MAMPRGPQALARGSIPRPSSNKTNYFKTNIGIPKTN